MKSKSLTLANRQKPTMKPALSALYKLMGSVKRPEKYKDMDIDEMIEKAKMEYFSKKKR